MNNREVVMRSVVNVPVLSSSSALSGGAGASTSAVDARHPRAWVYSPDHGVLRALQFPWVRRVYSAGATTSPMSENRPLLDDRAEK